MARPEVAIRRQAMNQMKAFITEFGMTPNSRGRVTVSEEKDKENPFLGLQRQQ